MKEKADQKRADNLGKYCEQVSFLIAMILFFPVNMNEETTIDHFERRNMSHRWRREEGGGRRRRRSLIISKLGGR